MTKALVNTVRLGNYFVFCKRLTAGCKKTTGLQSQLDFSLNSKSALTFSLSAFSHSLNYRTFELGLFIVSYMNFGLGKNIGILLVG